jgi:hypothetical protein
MRRTLWLFLIFLLLGGGTFWYLQQNREDDLMRGLRAERNFATPAIEKIQKIVVYHRDGETIRLQRQKGYWQYNGKHKVRPNVMVNLLDAVKRMEIKYKPSKAAVPDMIRNLAGEGIKVELYDGLDNIIKAYYIGGATPDERGTYLIMDGFDQPFVGHIPSWEGNLRMRFELKGEDWKDKTVFGENPQAIRSLSVEYPKLRNRSFKLDKLKNGTYEIHPFYSTTPQMKAPYREGSAESFLAGFESLVAEGFETENEGKDSIRQLLPFCIITLTNDAGETRQAKLHPVFPDQSLVLDPKTGQWTRNANGTVERYFADLNNGEFMLIQDRVFRKVLRGYEYFFGK